MRLPFYFFIIFLTSCTLKSSPKEDTSFNETSFITSLQPAVVIYDEKQTFTLSERMKRYGVPAASVAVVHNGKLVFSQSYGTLVKDGEDVATTKTHFQAASLSKAITALGILALAEDENISLTSTANSHLTNWKLPDGDQVTLVDLLSHSGGVNVPSYPAFGEEETLPTTTDILNGVAEAKSEAVRVSHPRGKYLYSGGGYMVLQKLIEDKTGESFSSFIERRVFNPAGVNSSHFKSLKFDTRYQDIAKGHLYNTEPISQGWSLYPQLAAAGLWSTPTDLSNILIAYLNAYQGNNETLFSSEQAKKLVKPIDQNMGLGFGSHGSGLGLHIDHAGWSQGYRSYMVAFPEKGDAAVIMTNGNAGNRLIDEMMRSLSAQLGWNAFQPIQMKKDTWSLSKLKSFEGNYKMQPAGFVVQLVVKEDHLEMSTPRGTKHILSPLSDKKLVMVEDGTEIKVIKGGSTLSFWGMTAVKQMP